MRLTLLSFLFLAFAVSSFAQQTLGKGMDKEKESGMNGNPQQQETPTVNIKKSIKTWHLVDDFTLADTLALDTMIIGFQQQNPVLRRNPMTLHTGNLGSPSHSMLLSHTYSNQDFFFLNSLHQYFPNAEDQLFYNTTIPYTNVTYSMGSPKRSEDNIRLIFTQNVNKKLNIGFSYHLMSSVGRYLGQQMNNEMSRIFMSYDGEKYSVASSISFNHTDHYENGGISDSSYILNPTYHNNPQSNTIPVNFRDAKNKLNNTHFFLAQQMGIGKIALKDSTSAPLPVGVIFHSIDLNSYKHIYTIDDLSSYYTGSATPFYQGIYADSLQTRDSTNLLSIKNFFQLKFNEEANSLLKFGVRAYIVNELSFYRFEDTSSFKKVNGEDIAYYHHRKNNYSNTAIGAQIFKNRGENFWWNAGFKAYIQGYKVGDTELTGKMNSRFKIGKDTAGVFAAGNITLRSAGPLYEKYFSNHIKWDNTYSQERTLTLQGGIRIPTKRFELTGQMRVINNYFYWNQYALPDQASGVTEAIEVNLNQSFKLGILNSINRVWWQTTSNESVLPLPTFSAYSSNFIESVLFKVLRFQIGFDATWHSSYYAQAYMPATGQFYVQNTQKTGNYPFADAFINLHLKRARIGLKFEHINKGLSGNNYFILPDYPANPRMFKICVSWNFFD
jgi:hypothetical protein